MPTTTQCENCKFFSFKTITDGPNNKLNIGMSAMGVQEITVEQDIDFCVKFDTFIDYDDAECAGFVLMDKVLCQEVSYKTTLEEISEETEASSHYGGFAWFYFLNVALGAVLTILISFLQFKSLANAIENPILIFGGILFSISFVALAAYVLVAFYRRSPNAIGLAKLHIYLILFLNALHLLSIFLFEGVTSNSWSHSPLSIVIGFIWQIIFLCYMYLSDEMRLKFPVETRRLFRKDKIAIISIASVIFLFYIGGFVYEIRQAHAPVRQLETFIEGFRHDLPIENEGYMLTDVYLENNCCVMKYVSTTYSNDDNSLESMRLESLLAKEYKLSHPDALRNDALTELCINCGYSIRVVWYDVYGNLSNSIDITADELTRIFKSDFVYSSSKETIDEFFYYYNKQLPMPFFAEDIYLTCTRLRNDTLLCDLDIKGLKKNELNRITETNMREYIIEDYIYIQSDYLIQLAEWNKWTLAFVFHSENDSLWEHTVFLTPNDYSGF